MNKLLKQHLDESGLLRRLDADPELQRFVALVEKRYGAACMLEDEAQADEGMLEALLDTIPGYVSWITYELTYLGVNRQLANAFGMDPSEFKGRPVNFLQSGGPFLDFTSSFLASNVSHKSKLIQTSFGAEGDEKFFMLCAHRYGGGRAAVVVGIDMTAAKRADAIIAEQRIKLEASAKMAELGQMAAGIAHEINNPLAVLTATNSLLERAVAADPIPREKVEGYTKRIEAMAARIAGIVKGCRTFSRDSSDDPFELASLQSVVSDSAEISRGRLFSQRVELFVDEISPDLMVECRGTQISQVLVNLLNNAGDAVQDLDTRWVRLSTAVTPEDKAVINVVDSGSGIPKEIHQKIFAPFFTTKPVGEGTGLGLNICRGIIEAHGGTIRIDQDAEHTTFLITLPLAQS